MKTTAHPKSLIDQINHLKPLVNALKGAANDFDKLEALNSTA